MENFTRLNTDDIHSKLSEKNEKNYKNDEDISNEDTKNKINLIKGTEKCIKVGNNSEKGKNLINIENLNEDVSIKNDKEFQNDIYNENMQSNTIKKEYNISHTIKDEEIKTKDSEIKNKDIAINELNPHEKKPLNFYEKPTLIGLKKIEPNSYMNASLQCLSQIEDLTNYFLDENNSCGKIRNNNIDNKNENLPQLSPLYLEL